MPKLNPIDEQAFNEFCEFSDKGDEAIHRMLQRQAFEAGLAHRDRQASEPLAWAVLTRDLKLHKVTSSEEKAKEKMQAQIDRFMWKEMSVQPVYLYQPKTEGMQAPSFALPVGLPIQTPVPLTESELKVFRLGWLECEAAHKQFHQASTDAAAPKRKPSPDMP